MLLRLATGDDAASLRVVYRPYVEHTAISFEADVPGADEMARRVDTTLPRHPWLVACDEATLLGYAYAHAFAARAAYRWSVETSVYVGRDCQGRGVGRALYSSLFALLALQGYRQAFAGIALPNAASIRLHERAAFRQVATFHQVGWKLGAAHDVGWWQREVGLHRDEPPVEPLSLDRVAPADIEAALASWH